nr:MAG TPA: hypothetical protein [Caudoviricetes sp.]
MRLRITSGSIKELDELSDIRLLFENSSRTCARAFERFSELSIPCSSRICLMSLLSNLITSPLGRL